MPVHPRRHRARILQEEVSLPKWFRLRAGLVSLLLFAAAPASAETADASGRWALRAGDTTLMTLDLRRTGAGWEGWMIRPKNFQIAPGPLPTIQVSDPEIVSEAVRGSAADGQLMLRVTDADGEETHWRLRIQGEGAELTLAEPTLDGAIAPLRLVKASSSDRVSADIAAGSRHVLPADLSTNPEMTAIFEADQADRRPAEGRAIDWAAVTPRDEARLARTLELLNAGALHSGDDFRHAAFILQHGGSPESYLLAHTLATIAAARGRPDATWIAAASLAVHRPAAGVRHPVQQPRRFRLEPGAV
jgi:hypothetical protein